MRRAVLALLLWCASFVYAQSSVPFMGSTWIGSASGFGPYPCLVTFEGGSNGTQTTAALMNTGSMTGCSGHTWGAPSGTVAGLTFSNSNQYTLPANFNIGGTITTGTGTLGMNWSTSSTPPGQQGMSTSGDSGTHQSMSGFIHWDWDTIGQSNAYDLLTLSGNTDYVIPQLNSAVIRLETPSGTSVGLGVPPTTKLWFTAVFNTNGTHKLSVYDPATCLLVGKEQTEPANGNNAPTNIAFGISGAEGEVTGHNIGYDNLVLDYTNGSYPVIPCTPAAPGAGGGKWVQMNQGTGSTLAYSSNVTSGNTMYAVIFDGAASGDTLTATDSQGNTWTVNQQGNLPTDGDTTGIACGPVGSSAANTVTFKVNGSAASVHAVIYEVQGGSCTVDVKTSTHHASGTSCDSGSVTTNFNNDIMVASCGTSGNTGFGMAVGWSFIDNTNNPGDVAASLGGALKLGINTAGSFTSSMEIAASLESVGNIVAYKHQ